ncbi:MAG: twin-arginine translocase TatA/TatE family subunit [Acidimicrobiales bacterium]
MAGIGAPELLIVLIIILLVFGGAKLPKLARSLGEAQREFRKGTSENASHKAGDGSSGQEDKPTT